MKLPCTMGSTVAFSREVREKGEEVKSINHFLEVILIWYTQATSSRHWCQVASDSLGCEITEKGSCFSLSLHVSGILSSDIIPSIGPAPPTLSAISPSEWAFSLPFTPASSSFTTRGISFFLLLVCGLFLWSMTSQVLCHLHIVSHIKIIWHICFLLGLTF